VAEDLGCDCLLVYGGASHGEPFRYITNFMPVLGDGFAILRSPTEIDCIMNFDWQIPEARAHSGVPSWRGNFDAPASVAQILASTHPTKIGVIGLDRLPHTTFVRFQTAVPASDWVDAGAAAHLRRIKSDLEIRLLREAGRVTDAALDDLRSFVALGQTEHEIAARAAYTMQSMGAGVSFDPTVIAGDDNPMTIRMPTDRTVQAGDAIMIDIGASVGGYQADAARTFVIGDPSPEQRKVWNVVVGAYDAAMSAIRPGVPAHVLYAAEAVMRTAGYQLVHRVGHGIGLATSFEWPSLDIETAVLQEGMTFCIEPGIYVKGAGNMKLEDDVVVTADGYELLTRCPSDLSIPLRR
jgi:Xaa-Pro dipeptidase